MALLDRQQNLPPGSVPRLLKHYKQQQQLAYPQPYLYTTIIAKRDLRDLCDCDHGGKLLEDDPASTDSLSEIQSSGYQPSEDEVVLNSRRSSRGRLKRSSSLPQDEFKVLAAKLKQLERTDSVISSR